MLSIEDETFKKKWLATPNTMLREIVQNGFFKRMRMFNGYFLFIKITES